MLPCVTRCTRDTHTFQYSFSIIFLGAFAKLRKANNNFIRFVRPSVRMEQLDSHWTDFFESVSRKFLFHYNRTRITSTLHEDQYTFLIISRSVLLWMRNCFKQKFLEEITAHILCAVTFFFRKSCRLWDNVEKYCRAEQATEDNMAHAHCRLD